MSDIDTLQPPPDAPAPAAAAQPAQTEPVPPPVAPPEIFATPDDLGEPRASQLHVPWDLQWKAEAGDAFMGGARMLGSLYQYRAAALDPDERRELLARATHLPIDLVPEQPPVADVPIADAQAQVKAAGLEGAFKLPDQPTIRQGVLDLMIRDAQDKRAYDAAISRGPQGFLPGALDFATHVGLGMIDPVNAAAFMVPVVGEERAAALLVRAGESTLARGAVRFGIGAAQGAAGTAALEPVDWWLHTLDGQDYTYADTLRSIVMGATMGGTFHTLGGGYGDLRARLRGLPLPGSPAEQAERALMEGLARPGAAPPEAALEEVPGIEPARPEGAPLGEAFPDDIFAPDEPAATGGPAGPFPDEMVADLPPPARNDLVHAAAADVMADRPGRAGEVLGIAAEQDPRIAESVDGGNLTLREEGSFGAEHWFSAVDPDGSERVKAVFTLRGDHAELVNVRAPGVGSLGEGAAAARNTVGPREIRNLLRQFKATHPEVKFITADRVSGARHGGEYEATGRPTLVKVPVPDEAARSEQASPPTPSPSPPRAARAGGGEQDLDAWRQLAAPHADPDAEAVAEASRAADKEPEPASVDPARSTGAAEAEAAKAEQALKELDPFLTEDERTRVREQLSSLDADREAQETIIRDGAACLMAAAVA